jgi:hypothetical protein
VCWNLQGFPFGRCIISGHISTCFSCKRINYSWDLPNYIYSFGDPKYEITTKKKGKKERRKRKLDERLYINQADILKRLYMN